MKDRINAIVGALESWAIDLEQGRQVWIPASTLRSAAKALSEQPAQQESEAVRAAWMAGYTEGEREAIEKAQQQEPVLWQILNGVCHAGVRSTENLARGAAAGMQKAHDLGGSLAAFHVRPLYTSPPASKPLTDDEIDEAQDAAEESFHAMNKGLKPRPLSERASYFDWHLARAIEAAHGITGEQP